MTTVDYKQIERRYQELLARSWRGGSNNADPGLRTWLHQQAREDVKRSEAEARQAAASREQALRAELQQALADGAGDLASLYRRAATSIGREHNIAIEWRAPSAMPSGASAYANWATRSVVVPVIAGTQDEIEQRFATFTHEAGHILCGVCGGGDHQPDPNVRDWSHCLRCERDAWEQAMQLWPPFTRAMFERLQSSLGSYRRKTPGPTSATKAVDRTRGSLRFAEHRQERLGRDVDVAASRLAWTLLPEHTKVDRMIAAQREQRRQMRHRAPQTTRTERMSHMPRFEHAETDKLRAPIGLKRFLEKKLELLQHDTACAICGGARALKPVGDLVVCDACVPEAKRRRDDARLDRQIEEQRARRAAMRSTR